MLETAEPIHILHVDDERDFAEMTARFIERASDRFSVETASSAEEGISRLVDGDFDCVVSDYEMPGRDGIEFLSIVHDRYPNLPFILFTGNGSEGVASQAISAGVTDYLQKKSGTEQYDILANRIENAVEQTRARAHAARQERILGILRDANRALVTSTTRAEIEAEITRIFASVKPYDLVWIGEYDAERDCIDLSTAAGERFETDAEAVFSLSKLPNEAVQSAIQTDEIATMQRGDSILDAWNEEVDGGYERGIVVPLVYQGERHGLFALYTTCEDAFDDGEYSMLNELAGDIAQALHTAETNRTLQRHQTAVKAVPEGVFIIDENTVIELANESAASLLGRPAHAVEGKPFPALIEEGVFEEGIVEWYRNSVREMLSSNSDRTKARLETEIRPDGSEPKLIEVHLTLRPYEDEFRGTVGIVRDITERKERERQLKTLIDNVPGIVYRCRNEDGWPMEHVRGEVEKLTGYSRSTLETERRMYGSKIIHPKDQHSMWAVTQDAVGNRKPFEITYRIRTKDGEVKWVWERGQGIYADDGSIEALEGFITDITERKQQQQKLERRNERLGEFASVLSHDLRNPLNVVQGRIALAREEDDNEHLESAANAVERSLALISDLLTLAREGEVASDLKPVDLAKIVDACWSTVETAESTLLIESERTVRADPSRLKRLLENLIRNAVEHGGDDVTITVGDLDGGFYVADDGTGIPRKERDRVFEVGYSSHRSGTGFGLNIVREIADSHGWEITVAESDAGGARFEITGIAGE